MYSLCKCMQARRTLLPCANLYVRVRVSVRGGREGVLVCARMLMRTHVCGKSVCSAVVKGERGPTLTVLHRSACYICPTWDGCTPP